MGSKQIILILCITISLIFSQGRMSDGDILQEIPIHPLPMEMTYEEYKDLNRKLNIGLMLTAIPIPGMLHSYAGEKETAKKLRYIGVAGLALIIAGASSFEESDDWESSKYSTVDINDLWYEQIPTSQIDNGDGTSTIDYKLIPLRKKQENKLGILFGIGVGVLVGNYIYDYIHGIEMIETKRDKVRFKYGKQLDFSLIPGYNVKSKTATLNFSYNF